jgi:hypothetical protein
VLAYDLILDIQTFPPRTPLRHMEIPLPSNASSAIPSPCL